MLGHTVPLPTRQVHPPQSNEMSAGSDEGNWTHGIQETSIDGILHPTTAERQSGDGNLGKENYYGGWPSSPELKADDGCLFNSRSTWMAIDKSAKRGMEPSKIKVAL